MTNGHNEWWKSWDSMSSLTSYFENEWKIDFESTGDKLSPSIIVFLWGEEDSNKISGSSKYLNSIARSYPLNPVCCVVTVCRQVRCLYWGYLSFFHKEISFKLTRNGLYERFNYMSLNSFLLHIYLYQICVYVFYVFEICGLQAFQF